MSDSPFVTLLKECAKAKVAHQKAHDDFLFKGTNAVLRVEQEAADRLAAKRGEIHAIINDQVSRYAAALSK